MSLGTRVKNQTEDAAPPSGYNLALTPECIYFLKINSELTDASSAHSLSSNVVLPTL